MTNLKAISVHLFTPGKSKRLSLIGDIY